MTLQPDTHIPKYGVDFGYLVEVTKWHTKNNDESISTAMLEFSLVTTATIAVFTFAVGTTKITYPLPTAGHGN